MREIGIREFRKNLAKELENLPLILTSHGKQVAIIIDFNRNCSLMIDDSAVYYED